MVLDVLAATRWKPALRPRKLCVDVQLRLVAGGVYVNRRSRRDPVNLLCQEVNVFICPRSINTSTNHAVILRIRQRKLNTLAGQRNVRKECRIGFNVISSKERDGVLESTAKRTSRFC